MNTIPLNEWIDRYRDIFYYESLARLTKKQYDYLVALEQRDWEAGRLTLWTHRQLQIMFENTELTTVEMRL